MYGDVLVCVGAWGDGDGFLPLTVEGGRKDPSMFVGLVPLKPLWTPTFVDRVRSVEGGEAFLSDPTPSEVIGGRSKPVVLRVLEGYPGRRVVEP